MTEHVNAENYIFVVLLVLFVFVLLLPADALMCVILVPLIKIVTFSPGLREDSPTFFPPIMMDAEFGTVTVLLVPLLFITSLTVSFMPFTEVIVPVTCVILGAAFILLLILVLLVLALIFGAANAALEIQPSNAAATPNFEANFIFIFFSHSNISAYTDDHRV